MTPEQRAAAEMRERAARIARNRAEGGHTSECERGHVEYDTNAFICSNRHGCLCAEREEEAEAIADLILSIPTPEPQPNPRDAALARAREALKIAHHELTALHNLRVTDLPVDQVEAMVAAGNKRENLEWTTDTSRALAAIESALKANVP